MRASKLAAGLAGLALVLAACSSGSDAEGDAAQETAEATAEETAEATAEETTEDTAEEAVAVDSIKIGSVHPLTGGLAADGLQMDAGAQLAAGDINAAGGIQCLNGATIEILSADSTGT